MAAAKSKSAARQITKNRLSRKRPAATIASRPCPMIERLSKWQASTNGKVAANNTPPPPAPAAPPKATQITVPLHALEVYRACEQEEHGRYAINGVKVMGSKHRNGLVGTDGRALVYVEFARKAGESGDGFEVIVPVGKVKMLLEKAKENKVPKNADVVVCVVDGKGTLRIRDSLGFTIDFAPLEGKFPKWQEIAFDEKWEGGDYPWFDCRLFGRVMSIMADAMNMGDDRKAKVRLPKVIDTTATAEGTTANFPARIEFEKADKSGKALGIVMPMDK